MPNDARTRSAQEPIPYTLAGDILALLARWQRTHPTATDRPNFRSGGAQWQAETIVQVKIGYPVLPLDTPVPRYSTAALRCSCQCVPMANRHNLAPFAYLDASVITRVWRKLCHERVARCQVRAPVLPAFALGGA